jgi:hypothetical protein
LTLALLIKEFIMKFIITTSISILSLASQALASTSDQENAAASTPTKQATVVSAVSPRTIQPVEPRDVSPTLESTQSDEERFDQEMQAAMKMSLLDLNADPTADDHFTTDDLDKLQDAIQMAQTSLDIMNNPDITDLEFKKRTYDQLRLTCSDIEHSPFLVRLKKGNYSPTQAHPEYKRMALLQQQIPLIFHQVNTLVKKKQEDIVQHLKADHINRENALYKDLEALGDKTDASFSREAITLKIFLERLRYSLLLGQHQKMGPNSIIILMCPTQVELMKSSTILQRIQQQVTLALAQDVVAATRNPNLEICKNALALLKQHCPFLFADIAQLK